MTKPLSKSHLLASKVMYAAMTILRDGGKTMKAADILEAIPAHVPLDAWALEEIESNGLPRWRMYVQFFSVDAVKSGYLLKSKGVWSLTLTGEEALALGANGFFSKAREGYRVWKKEQINTSKSSGKEKSDDGNVVQEPPEEQFERLRKDVNSTLVAEILERIKTNSWQFFERLVVELLLAMGYGGTGGQGLALQQGSDGGVDGFIHQDKLGLDIIYLQAKRWTNQTVGRPDIQQFVGALAGRQANRGVFITTSKFSQEAREYVKALQVRVILMDGERLAQLMIEHGVGVSIWKSYELKRIDSDFFSEE
ncbi:MAG: restriction endonuclease [Burkholderiaceae bacterium]|nr:restriction endonuclease [Burkholderiaceae bacterium]